MNEFLCGLTGDIVTPFNQLYNEERQGYNRAVQKFPLIIVYCYSRQDVSNAVIWARKNCVQIRIRSGGHNYEGYSNGNFTLVIDVSRMNSMYIDEFSNCLHVESGVTNGQVYNFVSSKGYPFPGGTCPTVGVSGYALGGGWGLSCRNFGLGCDSLKEIELVNYEGKIITANCEINQDLFWACRGAGGGNFGVILSMIFELPPKIDKVTVINIEYLNVDSEEQAKFMYTWQRWLKTADKRITLISRVYNSAGDNLSMLVRGIYYGIPEEALEIVDDFLRLNGAKCDMEYVTFLEAVTIIGSSYPQYEKFQSASRFVLRDLTWDSLTKLAGLIVKRPPGSVFTGISMYAMGGRVSEFETDAAAFFYRDAQYIIWLETTWEEQQYAEVNRDWIKNQFPHIECMTDGSYVNFPYKCLDCYKEEYYGKHTDILKKIKDKYDPLDVFSFPQGIGISGI